MSSTEPATALGSRENFWGETDVDELAEKPISELSTKDLRRHIDHETPFNVETDLMGDGQLRTYTRNLRDNGHDTQHSVTAYEKAQWVAHNILRQAADKLSATALHGSPNRGWEAAFKFVFQHLDGVEPMDDHDPYAVHTERCRVELTEPVLHVAKEHETGSATIEYGQYRHRRRYDPEHGYIGGVQLDDLPIEKFLDIVEIVLQKAKENHGFREARIEKWFAYAKRLKQEPNMCDEDVLAEVLTEIYGDDKVQR